MSVRATACQARGRARTPRGRKEREVAARRVRNGTHGRGRIARTSACHRRPSQSEAAAMG
eukprot:5955565-Prymnesium_polylepis.2